MNFKSICEFATRIDLLFLCLFLLHVSLAVIDDACKGRCNMFENVYCNSGTGVCDDCGIYCSKGSPFYNDEQCMKLCSKDITPSDACSNRCVDFNDTYCNAATGVCDSCSIYCDDVSPYFEKKKCAELCPAMVKTTEQPTTSSAMPSTPQQSNGRATIGTKKKDKFSLTTPETQGEKKPNLFKKNMPVAVCVSGGILVGLVAIVIICRHYGRRDARDGNSESFQTPIQRQQSNDVEAGLTECDANNSEDGNQKPVGDNGDFEVVISGTPPSDSDQPLLPN